MACESAVSRYRLSTPAQQDLTGILEYLLEEASTRIALRYERNFVAAFRSLAANPKLGHLRPDLTKRAYLFHLVHPYLIVYRKEGSELMIHAILHGAQDVEVVMEARS
jgi:plasmid stabilization system protein ParE